MGSPMVPCQFTMIPQFIIVKWLGVHVLAGVGINHIGALILPNAATAFGIFFLRQFFRTLPLEYEESARVDGASRLTVLIRIVLPLATPALATLAALTFLDSWNNFLWPLIAVTSTDQMTLPLGLATFQGSHQTQWPLLMAGNVMSLVPMLCIFFLAQRHFVRSVAITAAAWGPVAQAADEVIDLGFADEESVVQTRFATTELTLLRAHLGHDPGPAADAAERVLAAPLPP